MSSVLAFMAALAIGMLLGAFAVSMLAFDAYLHEEIGTRRHAPASALIDKLNRRLDKYKRWLVATGFIAVALGSVEIWRVWQWL